MKWINLEQAAQLLGVHPNTLRRHESEDGKWCTLKGQQFRVYREGIHTQPHRRYSEAELRRVALAIAADQQRRANRRRPWWA